MQYCYAQTVKKQTSKGHLHHRFQILKNEYIYYSIISDLGVSVPYFIEKA